MEIKFIGLTSVLIKSRKATVIVDPLSKDTGAKALPKEADMVCLSQPKSAYFDTKNFKKSYVISNPGEYELKGIMVIGIPVIYDKELRIVYQIITEEVSVVHLGGLAKKPKNGVFEELRRTDVLLVPVGGMFSLAAKDAKEMSTSLEPAYVVPINYKMDGMVAELKAGLDSKDEFLKLMEVKKAEPENKLKLKKSQVSGDDRRTNVVVLKPQSFKK